MSMSYFNPRTREGCDEMLSMFFVHDGGISIHAPVKGATRCDTIIMCGDWQFQSTHP